MNRNTPHDLWPQPNRDGHKEAQEYTKNLCAFSRVFVANQQLFHPQLFAAAGFIMRGQNERITLPPIA